MNQDELTDDRVRHLGSLVAQDNALLGLVVDGRYEVKRRIGRGGMGEVFLAQDLRLNRPVAVKILAQEAMDAEMIARFRSEAQTLAQLEHPGIVPIHDLGTLPDRRMYFAMKFVTGQTLQEILRDRPGRERLIEILASACDILHRAHERDIVHRDLKPANIMVDEEGQVYVMDWGIARSRATSGLTASGAVMGTLSYMSPEQARGEKSIDRRSDVYSLGAILFEILTGSPPVIGQTFQQALEAARSGTSKRITQEAPEYLKAACLRALSADPAARFPTAEALGKALRGVDRPRKKLSVFLPSILLLAAAGAFAGWKWLRPTPPAPKPLVVEEDGNLRWRRRFESMRDRLAFGRTLSPETAAEAKRLFSEMPESEEARAWFRDQIATAPALWPKSEWLERKSEAQRIVDWCASMGSILEDNSIRQELAAAADRFAPVLKHRGKITLKIVAWPYADVHELRTGEDWIIRDGKPARSDARVVGQNLATPLVIERLDIGDYAVLLKNREFGETKLELSGRELENGRTYVLSGAPPERESFAIRVLP